MTRTQSPRSRQTGRGFKSTGPKRHVEQKHTDSRAKCRNCGGDYPHEGGKTACPAYLKLCRACGKKNHFKSVCLQAAKINKQQMQSKPRTHPSKEGQKKTVYVVDDEEISEDSDDNSYETFTISVNNMARNRAKQPMFKVSLPARNNSNSHGRLGGKHQYPR